MPDIQIIQIEVRETKRIDDGEFTDRTVGITASVDCTPRDYTEALKDIKTAIGVAHVVMESPEDA
jgi:hypothetical protein